MPLCPPAPFVRTPIVKKLKTRLILDCLKCAPAGAVALELYTALTSLQQEKAEDPFGWVVPVV